MTNAGAQALQNLVIVDDRIASGAITCDRTTLTVAPAIGSTAVCRGTYVVTGADVVNGVVTNIATAQALPIGIGAQVVSNPSTVTVPLVSTLRLTKSVSTPPPYTVGQSVAYSYLVQNTGGTTLYTTVVNDDRVVKPAIVNCPSSTLAPGASMTCTANYIVRAGDVGANGVLVNTARATAQTSIGQQVDSNQSTGQINVFTDVGVTKVVNDLTPLVGSDVTFTVTADEPRTQPRAGGGHHRCAAGRRSDVRQRHARRPARYDAATGRWSIGTLTVGSSATLTIVATVITNVAVSNTATRTDMVQTDINPANDTAYVTLNPVPTVDHVVTKEVDRTDVPIGDQVQFTVRIQNIGPSPASGVTVSDLLPASLVYVSSSGDGSYDPVAGLWTVGNLAVSTTATLQIVATATALGTYTNLASLRSSTPPDNNSTNNSGNATVNVRNSNADLYIAKGVFPQVALVGDEVVYQVEVGNKGPDTARGVFVTDFGPAGVDLSSTVVPNVTATTGTITFDPDGTIRWDVGELAPNQTEQATIYAVLLTAGTKVNTSIVDAPNVIDPTPDDNRDTAQLVADPRPVDIGVTKTIDGASERRRAARRRRHLRGHRHQLRTERRDQRHLQRHPRSRIHDRVDPGHAGNDLRRVDRHLDRARPGSQRDGHAPDRRHRHPDRTTRQRDRAQFARPGRHRPVQQRRIRDRGHRPRSRPADRQDERPDDRPAGGRRRVRDHRRQQRPERRHGCHGVRPVDHRSPDHVGGRSAGHDLRPRPRESGPSAISPTVRR